MIMSNQRTEKLNSIDKTEKTADHQDSNLAGQPSKLDRRRRIEDLNEERRLREELNVF
jgi:hypothetical protein